MMEMRDFLWGGVRRLISSGVRFRVDGDVMVVQCVFYCINVSCILTLVERPQAAAMAMVASCFNQVALMIDDGKR
jgi:hypothetical protein